MTLRDFLNQNNLSLEKSMESRLGEIISETYRKDFNKAPNKKKVEDFENPVNDYPLSFLKSCEKKIIQFLTSIPEKTNGNV